MKAEMNKQVDGPDSLLVPGQNPESCHAKLSTNAWPTRADIKSERN